MSIEPIHSHVVTQIIADNPPPHKAIVHVGTAMGHAVKKLNHLPLQNPNVIQGTPVTVDGVIHWAMKDGTAKAATDLSPEEVTDVVHELLRRQQNSRNATIRILQTNHIAVGTPNAEKLLDTEDEAKYLAAQQRLSDAKNYFPHFSALMKR